MLGLSEAGRQARLAVGRTSGAHDNVLEKGFDHRTLRKIGLCKLRRHQVPERWGGRTGGQEVLLVVLAWGENWRLGSVDKADGARADAATISVNVVAGMNVL